MAVVVPLLSGVTTGYLAWLAEERDTIRFDHIEYWGVSVCLYKLIFS